MIKQCGLVALQTSTCTWIYVNIETLHCSFLILSSLFVCSVLSGRWRENRVCWHFNKNPFSPHMSNLWWETNTQTVLNGHPPFPTFISLGKKERFLWLHWEERVKFQVKNGFVVLQPDPEYKQLRLSLQRCWAGYEERNLTRGHYQPDSLAGHFQNWEMTCI